MDHLRRYYFEPLDGTQTQQLFLFIPILKNTFEISLAGKYSNVVLYHVTRIYAKGPASGVFKLAATLQVWLLYEGL